MKQERKMMSEAERNMFYANVELVNQQRVYLKDINKLIAYIKGNSRLKDEVKNIIRIYSRKETPNKYDKE